MPLHPSEALFDQSSTLPVLPIVDHYCGNLRFAAKALEIQKQHGEKMDVTLDLEDGAPRGQERELRDSFVGMLNEKSHNPKLMGLRVHEPSSAFFKEDLEVVLAEAGTLIRYITIPKPLDYKESLHAVTTIEQIASKCGLSTIPGLRILIETQVAVRDVWQIATLPYLEGLDFGCMDFVSSHGGALDESCMHSPEQFTHALLRRVKTEICAAALAHNLIPSHNVTVDFTDDAVVRSDATIANREFGFLRMWSIHPSQITPIIEAMSPSSELLKKATEVITAGEAANWGPARVHDRLHDRASYRYYWQILSRARMQNIAISASAERWF
jgi:citrate lyase subunit beta / citryl-CoA lyase